MKMRSRLRQVSLFVLMQFVLALLCSATMVFAAPTAPANPEQAVTNTTPLQGLELTVTRVRLAGNSVVVEIAEGTPIVLITTEMVTSKTVGLGDQVNFVVSEDVKGPNGEIIIAKGTPAKGTVREVDKSNYLGIPGKLTISIDSTQTVDKIRVPLAGSIQADGKDQMLIAIGGGIACCVLMFAIKGGEAIVPAGRETRVRNLTSIRVVVQ